MKKVFLIIPVALFITGCGTTITRVTPLLTDLSQSSEENTASLNQEIRFPNSEPIVVNGDVCEATQNGEIDWSDNTIRATGMAVLDPNNPNTSQARLMAERAAIVIAQRNLLETVQGVRINSETRVENFMTDYDVIYTRVEGVVKNARQIGSSTYNEDAGTVEVELEMEIHNDQGLSGALASALTTQQIANTQMSSQTRDFLEQYSAIVFNGSQAGLTPSMYPKIYDSNGNLLLDTSEYSQYLNSTGDTAMQFISDINQILSQPAFAQSPLVIDILQVTGQFGSDIILNQQQSDSLGWLKAGLPYLISAGKFLMNVVL